MDSVAEIGNEIQKQEEKKEEEMNVAAIKAKILS